MTWWATQPAQAESFVNACLARTAWTIVRSVEYLLHFVWFPVVWPYADASIFYIVLLCTVQCVPLPLQSDTAFVQKVKRIRDPKLRMSSVHNHCKGKMICDATEPDPEADVDMTPDELRKIGCGHAQPVIRKEGLKLFMIYKKAKDDEEQVTLPWSASEDTTYLILFRIGSAGPTS